jgi:hypothetical protein
VAELRRYAAEDTALRGSSPAMKKLKDAIARVAPIPSTVLIIGESGSGKELVARDVHRLSGRAREPFVAVNCGALAESLIESELFGHERGAFTGANTTRKGAFEAAGKGTIFLDEIGELPAAAQAKLLRVLEERQVVRVGATHPLAVPARVIAATHRDLEKDVPAGRFRHDLYFRLAVHVLHVPPLRDRLSDLPELADHILAATCERFGMRRKTISAGALEMGGVRLGATTSASSGTSLSECSSPPTATPRRRPCAGRDMDEGSVTRAGREPRTFLERKAEAERQIVVAALERNGVAHHADRAGARVVGPRACSRSCAGTA